MDHLGKYRQLSEELRSRANSQIYPESRAQMLQLAEHWESMANQLEYHMRRGGTSKTDFLPQSTVPVTGW